jgi:hypothetical protein
MAGMGPPPKPAATRARRNRVTTAAVLHAPDPGQVVVPPLPDRPQDWHHPLLHRPPQHWHPLTRAWWADLWTSPMAAEYDPTDVHGLLQLAVLVDDFWHAETPRERQAASAEIRLQGVRFGLSPIDRRRLQWEIQRSDEAQARRRRRQAIRPPQDDPTGPTPTKDPRSILRPVPGAGGTNH